MMSNASAECDFKAHDWEGGVLEAGGSRFVCKRCGVGHEVTATMTGEKQATVQLKIFPAPGSATVSQSVAEWSRMVTETTVDEMRNDGWAVNFEEIVLGIEDDSGSQKTKEGYFAGLLRDSASETVLGMVTYGDPGQVLEDLEPTYMNLSAEELTLSRKGYGYAREFGLPVVRAEMPEMIEDSVREVRARVPELWHMLVSEAVGTEKAAGMIRMVGMVVATFAFRRFGQKAEELRKIRDDAHEAADKIFHEAARRAGLE